MYLFFIFGGLGKKKNVSPGIKAEAETFSYHDCLFNFFYFRLSA